MTLREIAIARLAELNISPIDAAKAAGIERTFVRDLVEGKKGSVRSDKIPDLARALRLDAAALARGEMVPLELESFAPLTDEERSLIATSRRVPLDDRGLVQDVAQRLAGPQEVEQDQPAPSAAQAPDADTQ